VIADRWGVSDDEVARRYPCDEYVLNPAVVAWRGVTVHATAGELWPWLVQVRLAPYSYDWIDNLGRRSPGTLRNLPDPVAGEHFSIGFGRPVGRILAVVRGESLTAGIAGALMSYVLVPEGDDVRLLLKVVTSRGRTIGPLICLADLVMARRQLLNFKRLAESSTPAPPGRS
jgi:hypothetical protein